MAKQTFTTGSVLTATQMNNLQANDYNQTVSQKTASYVLVAADAGTRIEMNAAGATTVTVNTGLFTAGDTLFIQNIGAGVCTVTAGTATVNKYSAGSLALAQYQGGTLYFVSASSAVFFADAGFTSPLTTKGDLFTWDTGNARLAVGTNGQILTADSTAGTGLKWADASAGMTLLSTTTLTGSSTSISVSPSGYNYLHIEAYGITANANYELQMTINNYTSATHQAVYAQNRGGTYNSSVVTAFNAFSISCNYNALNTDSANLWVIDLYNPNGSSSLPKNLLANSHFMNISGVRSNALSQATVTATNAISSIQFICSGGSYNTGTVKIWGVK